MKKQLALGLATVLCAVGASAFAGDEPGAEKPEMYCVIKDIVKPALTEQYEAAIKKMISEYKAYQIDPEKVHWKAVSGPEIGYVYVMPMENWASMDTMWANWMETVEIIGEERFTEMMAPATEATEEVQWFHVLRRADLSYVPENPRLAKEEIEYIHYGFYYVLPGKEKEIEAIAKEFVDLYQSKGIDTGWSLYQSLTGNDLPVIVVAQGAKSEADYHANRARLHELLGEEAKMIGKKVGATIRKSEYKDGYTRPDLSYPGPDAEPARKEAHKGDAHEGHGHEGHDH
jgi:hypothetical protein